MSRLEDLHDENRAVWDAMDVHVQMSVVATNKHSARYIVALEAEVDRLRALVGERLLTERDR